MRPLRWWAESAPPGGNRVKVSENLGATSVAPVAPVDTSLSLNFCFHNFYLIFPICDKKDFEISLILSMIVIFALTLISRSILVVLAYTKYKKS